MAIEVAGKRFVTLADEFFVNGAKVYEAYANGVKVYPDISGVPAYMKITTLPDKLVYKPGDTMDYTGIVCTLFNADGTVFTDERYPDGTIPFDELEFPIEKAPAVGTVYVTDGIPGGNLSFPIPLYPLAFLFRIDSQVDDFTWFYPDSDAYMLIESINDIGIKAMVVSERRSATIISYNKYRNPEYSTLATANSSFMQYDKIAYFGEGTHRAFNFYYDNRFPESGVGDANEYDAWNILYGTHEGDDSAIPVNWKSTYSGDDRTLTDKFNITNREVMS